MSTLAPLLQELRSTLQETRPSGVAPTGVPGVTFFWNDQPVPRAPLLYNAGIVIIGQGHKVGYLGGHRFEYDADTCLVLGVPVPFDCEVSARPEEPLLGIRIDIDITSLHGLVARFRGRLGLDEPRTGSAHVGVEPVRMDGPLLDATTRLIACLGDPMDRQVVGPAAVDEIIYRVLRGKQGHVLYALTQHHTPYASIARALERMHKDYRQSLVVEELAKGLLVFDGARVDEAAYGVGYVSASQFSREFKRYFSVPPSEAQLLPYSDAP